MHHQSLQPSGCEPNPYSHVGLIMDGNRRWAAERGLPSTAGHVEGELRLFEIVDGCVDIGLPWLTVFAFSTENWQRDSLEVAAILGVITTALERRLEALHARKVRIRCLGETHRLPPRLQRAIAVTESLTEKNTGLTLTICIGHGGRQYIIEAVRKVVSQVRDGVMAPADISQDSITASMAWPDMPDVDLLIRTSGEQRISNFLLWHITESALRWVEKLWPDYTKQDFLHDLRHHREEGLRAISQSDQ
jgi:undecaprenyl diphosphate synthase